jgi:DNA repair exonuclease SbcCD ATPase subunit
MENRETAQFIVGTLLGQPVVSIDAKAQELSYTSEDKENVKEAPLLRLMRLDFVATIKTESGEYKKVLIEMQKALKMVDIMRFRDYLAEQYKREDVFDGQQSILPIIPIYILGDELPEVDTAYVKIDRSYYDGLHKRYILKRSYFIERLTHDCVVVQTARIESDHYETKLDKLLSVFEQKYFVEDNKKTYKDYKHVIDDENIRQIISILHYCASDIEERKRIEAEHEAWRVYSVVQKNYLERIEEQMKSLAEKNAILAETNATLAKKDAILAETNATLAKTNATLAEKDTILAEKDAIIVREQEEKNRLLAEREALMAELDALKNSRK